MSITPISPGPVVNANLTELVTAGQHDAGFPVHAHAALGQGVRQSLTQALLPLALARTAALRPLRPEMKKTEKFSLIRKTLLWTPMLIARG